ncbi:hypothetical protein [Nonomuraea sp. 10N515B]|uniref:hypothetical protein n=1 Tax=Nonomuraea sp. 10N515B TaxID=3457422 RepID=UPI003FCD1F89
MPRRADFAAFLGLLAVLPLEVSQIDRADQIAAEPRAVAQPVYGQAGTRLRHQFHRSQ